jgi:hypothetical protein
MRAVVRARAALCAKLLRGGARPLGARTPHPTPPGRNRFTQLESALVLAIAALGCGGTQTAGAPAAPLSSTSQENPRPAVTSASSTPSPAASALAPASSGPGASPPAPAGVTSVGRVDVTIGEIPATPKFDPHATIEALRSNLLACYRKALEANASIHGKLTLRIHVAESGAVLRVEAGAGPANDPGLVRCINDDFTANAHFPRPGGTAVVVTPLVFHSAPH